MIQLKLDGVLKERKLSVYWLWKETGIRYATLWQMKNGDVARLSLDALDKVCSALACQPGDLLIYVDGNHMKAGQ